MLMTLLKTGYRATKLMNAIVLGLGVYKAIRDREEDPARKRVNRKGRSARAGAGPKRKRLS